MLGSWFAVMVGE